MTIEVDDKHLVVQVVQRAALPCVVSQRNCHYFGFALPEGGPDAKGFLRFLRRHGIPAAKDGHLRLVLATELLAAIGTQARAPVRVADPTPRDEGAHDDALLARQGVTRRVR